jgi:hypothetical protein
MLDRGAEEPSPEQLVEMEALVDRLARYRRSDTSVFVDAVGESIRAWLSSGADGVVWHPAAGVPGLGRVVEDAFHDLWPDVRAFWGAELSEEDRAALAT